MKQIKEVILNFDDKIEEHFKKISKIKVNRSDDQIKDMYPEKVRNRILHEIDLFKEEMEKELERTVRSIDWVQYEWFGNLAHFNKNVMSKLGGYTIKF